MGEFFKYGEMEKYVSMVMRRVQERESSVQSSQEGRRAAIWSIDEGRKGLGIR